MLRGGLAVGLLCALGLGCASPTLPLPPPEVPSVTMVDATHVTLFGECGSVEAYADVIVENIDRIDPTTNQAGSLFHATQCGSWSGTVYARNGDHLRFQQVLNGTSGLPEEIQLQLP
jgi:hypothetical protein